VTSIRRADFDHARTRNLIAAKATGDTLVFFTQDVAPVSGAFLETLTQPVRSGIAAAAYARQIPAEDATLLEAFARSFNYPSEPSLRHISRVSRRTLKTFFFSNAASAVSRSCFESVGGFPEPAVTNEDMLLCARLLDACRNCSNVITAWALSCANISHCFAAIEAEVTA
jgi:rhamnosyltransferase